MPEIPDDLQITAALMAAGKHLKKTVDDLDEPIPEGVYPVDATLEVRVKGTLEKCPEQEYQASPLVPLCTVLAIVALKLKAGRDKAKKIIGEAISQALAGDLPKAKGFADRDKDVAELVVAAITNAPKITKTRAGQTKWSGESTASVVFPE